MIDRVKQKIAQILLSQTAGISEYELISMLRKEPDPFFEEVALQNAHELFQLHFLIFHCLYQIRDEWLVSKKACLQIDVLKIQLFPYSRKNTTDITVEDSIRQYYLDSKNLEQTSADDADELINQFWKKFAARTDKVKALQILELETDASYEQVKKQYRRLAMEYHPDRGGDADRLAEINRSMEILKRSYR